MKTLFRSFILLLAAILLFSTDVLAKNNNAKLSLVSLGDSIPFGYNLGNNDNASPSKQAFPYLIGEDTNMRVRNLAIPGWKTDNMLAALETNQQFRQAVRHGDYITLNIGNNDLLQALHTASVLSGGNPDLFAWHLNDQIEKSNLFKNLSNSIGEIRSLTNAPVVVYNVYNPFQNDDPLHGIGNMVLPGINWQFQQLVAGLNYNYGNIVIADAFGAFGNSQADYVIAGDIHPTIAGQRKLADVGLIKLNTLINK